MAPAWPSKSNRLVGVRLASYASLDGCVHDYPGKDARAVQVSPERDAVTTKRSVPALLGAKTRASNEPLGARVTLVSRRMTIPFCRKTTDHLRPTRF